MPARRRLLAVVAAALVLLAGCQMQVAVDVHVNDDGTGTVVVGVGLDDAALARAGDLDEQLRVADLQAAGWTVTEPAREGTITWVRASKPFTTADQLASIMAELNGPHGAFRDFALTKDSGLSGTTWKLDGVVDLTAGPEAFSDQELAAALGGDPFGGTLQAIEQQEGRPIADMVDFNVSVLLPGASSPAVYHPSFRDEEPTAVQASSTQGGILTSIWIWAFVALLAVIGLFALRRGFRRTRL